MEFRRLLFRSNVSFFFAMNEAKFNSLPKEDQQAIEGLSGEAFATLCGKAWDVADQEGLQAAQKAGNSITEASPEMVANLREELSVLESDWIDRKRVVSGKRG